MPTCFCHALHALQAQSMCKTPRLHCSASRGKCAHIYKLVCKMVDNKQQPDKAASEKKVADNKKKKQKAEEDKDADLSEEDLELKNNLLLMVTRIGEDNPGVQKLALQQVANEIRSATTSMTSVPKPLKFLRAHYQTLVDTHDRTSDADVRRQLADVLSVLAITTSKEGERACLKFRLLGSKVRNIQRNPCDARRRFTLG